jgi:methionyl-tRNA formyltransferase
MGTPDFAVESLKKLVESGSNVVAVITAPDKPAGRGKKLQASPVKIYAESQEIPVLQPPRLKNPAFIEELSSYKADIQVVVAFRMLPEVVWDMPPFGTINLHGSLLPQYRGAAPINWAVINGETETGVTTFFIEKEIDTGKIIYKETIPINSADNAGTMHDKLMILGADLVLKTVRSIEDGNYPQIDQEEFQELKSAPKIFKEDCKIDWSKPAVQIQNFIRGLSPYPAAWSTFKFVNSEQDENLKIFSSEITQNESIGVPGTIISDNKTFMHIACKDGYISVTSLQMPSKKRLNMKDFLRGFDINQIEIS